MTRQHRYSITARRHPSDWNVTILPRNVDVLELALTATDNCDGTISVTADDISAGAVTGDGCDKSQQYTVVVSDECDNNAEPCLVTFNWKEDEEKPVLTGCPTENPTVQCYADVPAAAIVTALDECDGAIAVNFEETQSNPESSCDNVITRTWTAIDKCGNDASCTQTITVDDTEAPVLPELPTGGDLGCNNEPSCTEGLMAADNCGDVPVICTPGGIVDLGGCKFSQTFTYSAEDDCGNMAPEQTVTYTWTDDQVPPVFTNCPEDITFTDKGQMEKWLAENPIGSVSVTATDDCSTPTVEYAETDTGAICDESGSGTWEVVRTWTATDDCGNTEPCEQYITADWLCCDTAWAQIGTNCFNSADYAWGWYYFGKVGDLEKKYMKGQRIPVYAGAAGCDPSKGWLVGYVTIIKGDGEITITFEDVDDGWNPYEWHIWLSKDDPRLIGGLGNWPYQGTEDSITIPYTFAGRDNVYFAIHRAYCQA